MTARVARGDLDDRAHSRRPRGSVHGADRVHRAGQRLLQGCYADLDGLASSLAVLEGVAA